MPNDHVVEIGRTGLKRYKEYPQNDSETLEYVRTASTWPQGWFCPLHSLGGSFRVMNQFWKVMPN